MAKAPAPSGPADLPAKVAELDAAKSTPKISAAPVDPGKLLAGLAKALRDSDEKAARAILKQLHGLLYPPVPDDQNAILIYQKAFDIAREKLGGLIPKGLDRTAYSAVFSGEEMNPEQAAALRAWFEKDGAALSEVNSLLRDAAKMNQCRLPGGEAELKALTGLQTAGQLLRVSALMEHQGGRTAEAADLVLAELGVARLTRSTPNHLAQILGCAIEFTAFQGLREMLDPSTPAIATWLDGVDPASVRSSSLRALLGNVDLLVSEVFAVRENPARSDDEEFRKQALSPLAFQDMAAYVESMIDFSKLAERPYYEAKSDLDALMCSHGELAPWYASLTQDTVRGMDGLSRVVARSEATTSMAKLSLELERYRVKNTGYPESLDALKFKGLPDPFTGQPFIYRRDGIGFVLESPGGAGGKDAQTWRSR